MHSSHLVSTCVNWSQCSRNACSTPTCTMSMSIVNSMTTAQWFSWPGLLYPTLLGASMCFFSRLFTCNYRTTLQPTDNCSRSSICRWSCSSSFHRSSGVWQVQVNHQHFFQMVQSLSENCSLQFVKEPLLEFCFPNCISGNGFWKMY